MSTIVIEVPGHLSPEQLASLKEKVNDAFPGNGVIILDGGAKLSVVPGITRRKPDRQTLQES